MALDDFTHFLFTHDGYTRTVYRRGSGPGVVIMHVLPGMIPEVIDFGRRVADAGFTAFLPHMFGVPGRPLSTGYICGQFVRVCLRPTPSPPVNPARSPSSSARSVAGRIRSAAAPVWEQLACASPEDSRSR